MVNGHRRECLGLVVNDINNRWLVGVKVEVGWGHRAGISVGSLSVAGCLSFYVVAGRPARDAALSGLLLEKREKNKMGGACEKISRREKTKRPVERGLMFVR